MLVLTRKVGEKITIRTPDGAVIEIMLTNIDGKKARIGIEAPREFAIVRNELLPNSSPPEPQS
ncbi:MAG TPA: carbon storage regulator [Gemmata sp.]